MNENTEKLIRELADKLGTTVEHLWGVMVKQAPISASLNVFIIACAFLVILIFYFKGKSICDTNEDKSALVIMCAGGTIILLLFILIIGESTVSGFFNPEYWALKQLKVVK